MPPSGAGLHDNFEARGYRVLTTADGQTGLDEALSGQAEVIVLDIMLPKVNGYEIVRRLRESGSAVPVIMLTAKGQEDDIILGLRLGADDYVTKPFSIRELAARVQAALRRQATDGHNFSFGPFQLDLASRKLFRDGNEVELAAKEYRLLELFVKRRGRALTRETILDIVWGASVFVTTRSVDRCVTTLRAKIEANPRRPAFVRTIREIGYRFEA